MRVEGMRTMNPILCRAEAERGACRGRLREVLRCMWDGKNTKEIAADLGISPKTVEYHRARLYELFGVRDPIRLCRRGIEAGVLNSRGVPICNTSPRRITAMRSPSVMASV